MTKRNFSSVEVELGILVLMYFLNPVNSKGTTNEAFSYLLLSNDRISKNDTINEKILDLVAPMLLDSVVDKRKQHHKVWPLGWLIHTFGNFNWRAISKNKEKFVGTIVRQSRSGEEEFTEYDINFDLNFHLDKYLKKVFKGYDIQGKYRRQDITHKERTDFKAIPFVRDTNNINIRDYRLHCELTPPRAFRSQLNYLFYPAIPGGGGLAQHPNFGTDFPTVGFYGVFCSDCNHSCHPEIHPYEWMWWLKTNDRDSSFQKIWTIGLFHESSNRMKNWSVNPMSGSIAIPFAFKLDPETPKNNIVEIEHLVFNKFTEKNFSNLKMGEKFFGPDQHQQISITNDGKELTIITVRFSRAINTQFLKFWFSQLNFDENQNVISGYFHFATSVEDLYTTQIRFKQN